MSAKSDPIELSANELYTTRLILLMETEPQSNKYMQICLDKDQFRKVSDALAEVTKVTNCPNCGAAECTSLELDDDHVYDLYSEIKSINEHESTT